MLPRNLYALPILNVFSYDTFVIDMVVVMLGYVYGTLTPGQQLGMKAAGSIGTFFGMLIFGYLGDRLGRKRVCEYTVHFLFLYRGELLMKNNP